MHDRCVLITFAPTQLLSAQGGFSMSWQSKTNAPVLIVLLLYLGNGVQTRLRGDTYDH